MARLLVAVALLLCCASLGQAATKAAKTKDVTKLQIGVKVLSRGAGSAALVAHEGSKPELLMGMSAPDSMISPKNCAHSAAEASSTGQYTWCSY